MIEDAAQGIMSSYKGRPLGSIGHLATLSFHETKNIISGEGGALLVNDASFSEQAEIIREKGTNRSRFLRGLVDKYTWVDLGSSYLPSDILAAYLLAQLEAREEIQHRRQEIWLRYQQCLQGWARNNGVGLPFIPEYCEQAFHMYYLLMPSLEIRQNFIAYLKALNILSVFHYLPLHLSVMGEKFGGAVSDCPVTEDVSDRLVRLPFHNSLSNEDQERIIAAVLDFKV